MLDNSKTDEVNTGTKIKMVLQNEADNIKDGLRTKQSNLTENRNKNDLLQNLQVLNGKKKFSHT